MGRGFRRLGWGSGSAGEGGGSAPATPYEAAISGTSGTVLQATHGQSTTPTVVFKRSGVAFETYYSINGSGDVSWSSSETLSAVTDTILISG